MNVSNLRPGGCKTPSAVFSIYTGDKYYIVGNQFGQITREILDGTISYPIIGYFHDIDVNNLSTSLRFYAKKYDF